MVSTTVSCKENELLKEVFFLCMVIIYVPSIILELVLT